MERLYHLDLDQKYVSNIKLVVDERIDAPDIKIDIILDYEKVIGYLEGTVEEERLFIKNIFVDENERNRGIASSALRQLGTFLRRNMKEISELAVAVNEDESINKLFEYVGFARFKETDKDDLYIKYIKY